jgi:hypothetical protein
MFTGHSGKGSIRRPEVTFKENRVYFDDVFLAYQHREGGACMGRVQNLDGHEW